MRLAEDAAAVVWFGIERGRVSATRSCCLSSTRGRWQTVRVYDNTHGQDEMHRHTLSGGKQAAEVLSPESDFGVAMRAAREDVIAGYEKMIQGWRR